MKPPERSFLLDAVLALVMVAGALTIVIGISLIIGGQIVPELRAFVTQDRPQDYDIEHGYYPEEPDTLFPIGGVLDSSWTLPRDTSYFSDTLYTIQGFDSVGRYLESLVDTIDKWNERPPPPKNARPERKIQ